MGIFSRALHRRSLVAAQAGGELPKRRAGGLEAVALVPRATSERRPPSTALTVQFLRSPFPARLSLTRFTSEEARVLSKMFALLAGVQYSRRHEADVGEVKLVAGRVLFLAELALEDGHGAALAPSAS